MNPILSLIFVHFSTDDYKSYVSERCLTRLWYMAKWHNLVPTELIVVNNCDRDLYFKDKCDIYIQNDNRSLGRARNKAFDVSKGKYVCFMDDDIYPDHRFWHQCLQLLEKYPDKKLIATPIYTGGHVYTVKHDRGFLDGHLLNTRSGSNCLLMKWESFEEIGRFDEPVPQISPDGKVLYHGLEGVDFCNRQIKKGYLVIHTWPGQARDLGLKLHNYAIKSF